MPDSLSHLLEGAVRLAGEAGEAILRIYEDASSEVRYKEDDSPLTAADLESQRVLAAGLRELAPDVPLLSEEAAEVPWEARRRWRRLWLVDPLDGTKEFLKRNGEFTVNVALVEEGVPVLGVVGAPALGRTYLAARELGAFRQEAGGDRRPIRATGTTGDEPVVVASRSHPSAELEALLAALPAHRLTSLGSALKICLVAEGAADLYPRLGPTMEWDTAAAHAVVLAAGGRVVDLSGEPLRYNQRDLRNPHFVVEGERRLPWRQALAWLPER